MWRLCRACGRASHAADLEPYALRFYIHPECALARGWEWILTRKARFFPVNVARALASQALALGEIYKPGSRGL